MDLDDALRESRRRLLVLTCLLGALAWAVLLGHELVDGQVHTVAARTVMVVSTVVLGLQVHLQRVRIVIGERLIVGSATVFGIVDLSDRLLSLGDGPVADWWLGWLSYAMLLLVGMYVVFSRERARRSAGLLLVPLYALGAVAMVVEPVSGSVAATSVVPLVGLALIESMAWRLQVMAGHEARSRAEAEAGRRDMLTGLPNRRGVLPALERVEPGDALLLLDIDRFKRVNDEHGHEAGDVVLRQVAARLQRACRGGDVVGRWGGEEFLLVARAAGPEEPGEDTADRGVHVVDLDRADGAVADGGGWRRGAAIDVSIAIDLAERLRRSVATIDTPVAVTTSVGVSFVGPDDDWQEALRRADACLYEAKATGRDRVVHSPGAWRVNGRARQRDGVEPPTGR